MNDSQNVVINRKKLADKTLLMKVEDILRTCLCIMLMHVKVASVVNIIIPR